MIPDEDVLVFPRTVLDELGTFQGLCLEHQRFLNALSMPGVATFHNREQVERDTSKKQIIPYVILEYSGKLLFYVRGKRSNEERLISSGSIGFGGHIVRQDSLLWHGEAGMFWTNYNSAVEREIHEELSVRGTYEDQILGIINDDTTDVGRVHFGIVHIWKLQSPEVQRKEQKITQLAFLTPHDIAQSRVQLESWSRICLQHLTKP